MSKTLNTDGTLSIEEYSLVELLPQVLQAHKDGFEFNFDLNDGVPQQYAALTILKMYPVKGVQVGSVAPSNIVQPEVTFTKDEQTSPDDGVPEVQSPVKVDGRRKK